MLFFGLLMLFVPSGKQVVPNCECLKWNENISFDWNFYRKIDAPEDTFPSARSACKIEFTITKDVLTRSYLIKIYCCLDTCNSWVVRNITYNQVLLSHEKGHFDIQEIFSRKLRNDISRLNSNGLQENEVHKKMDSLFTINQNQLDLYNTNYDLETNYSMDQSKQKEWNIEIHAQLNTSSNYRDSTITINY
jgi:hypothetical protein